MPQAELRVAPPPTSGGTSASPASPPKFTGPLDCVAPPDPEFDKESPWSKEVGARLERALPSLRRCTADLPATEEARLTLRLVYDKAGAPASQHVIDGMRYVCAATDCLKQELAKLRSPELVIDQGSYDLALVLKRDAVPQRVAEPTNPLVDDDVAGDPSSCVDPAVARLSQEKVREVVSTSYDQLKACYGQALVRDHAISGNVTFEFVIGRAGEVTNAQARAATFPDCQAIECMLGQFRALNFPAPVGRSVRVIYPINYVIEQAPMTLR